MDLTAGLRAHLRLVRRRKEGQIAQLQRERRGLVKTERTLLDIARTLGRDEAGPEPKRTRRKVRAKSAKRSAAMRRSWRRRKNGEKSA